jgi:hypothetical protein
MPRRCVSFTSRRFKRNQSLCGPASFVPGRRFLMVASTLVQWLRDAVTLISL